MRTLSTRGKLAVLTSVIAVWGTFTYACTVEDENPATERTVRVDSGSEGSIDPTGSDAQVGAPICGTYGGYEKVKQIAAAIIARVANDCRINAPFANLNPQRTQRLAECFEIQLGGFFQCPNVVYESGKTKVSNDQTCRSMTQAHAQLNLRKADFDAFRADVESELTAQGLTPDHVRSIAAAFEGTRTGVVQTNNQPNANTYCACDPGGNPTCTKPIIDAGPDVTDAGSDVTDGGDSG